jgi:hypothetical protein
MDDPILTLVRLVRRAADYALELVKYQGVDFGLALTMAAREFQIDRRDLSNEMQRRRKAAKNSQRAKRSNHE